MDRFGIRNGMTKACVIALLTAALALGGCMSRRGDIPYAPASFDQAPDSTFANNTEYRLGPADVVSLAVYRAPELTGDYRVDAAGNLNLPLIGAVQVQGQSLPELTETLRTSLGERYYVDPDVTVSLKEVGSQRVTVDGSVNRAGLYPLPNQSTLMQVIAMAGGTSATANPRRVIVFRQIDGRRQVAGFDLAAIRSGRMEDPLIYGSDIIIVDGDDTRQNWRDALSAIPIIALFRPFF